MTPKKKPFQEDENSSKDYEFIEFVPSPENPVREGDESMCLSFGKWTPWQTVQVNQVGRNWTVGEGFTKYRRRKP